MSKIVNEPKTIARGDDCCAIRYIHREGKAEVC